MIRLVHVLPMRSGAGSDVVEDITRRAPCPRRRKGTGGSGKPPTLVRQHGIRYVPAPYRRCGEFRKDPVHRLACSRLGVSVRYVIGGVLDPGYRRNRPAFASEHSTCFQLDRVIEPSSVRYPLAFTLPMRSILSLSPPHDSCLFLQQCHQYSRKGHDPDTCQMREEAGSALVRFGGAGRRSRAALSSSSETMDNSNSVAVWGTGGFRRDSPAYRPDEGLLRREREISTQMLVKPLRRGRRWRITRRPASTAIGRPAQPPAVSATGRAAASSVNRGAARPFLPRPPSFSDEFEVKDLGPPETMPQCK